MKETVIYSTLTKPEMMFGLPKEALGFFVIFFAIFNIARLILDFSMLWILPFGILLYLIFFIAAKVDPFYFSIAMKKDKFKNKRIKKGAIKVRQTNKKIGDYYAS